MLGGIRQDVSVLRSFVGCDNIIPQNTTKKSGDVCRASGAATRHQPPGTLHTRKAKHKGTGLLTEEVETFCRVQQTLETKPRLLPMTPHPPWLHETQQQQPTLTKKTLRNPIDRPTARQRLRHAGTQRNKATSHAMLSKPPSPAHVQNKLLTV